MYRLGKASLKRLEGVHPDLVKCVQRALSYGVLDFSVAQGVRTKEEQAQLYAQGRTKPGNIVTWTLNSNHIKKSDGFGYAVDLVPFTAGRANWEDQQMFYLLATLMFQAAMEEGLQIAWGGHWQGKKDLPHFELKTRKEKL